MEKKFDIFKSILVVLIILLLFLIFLLKLQQNTIMKLNKILEKIEKIEKKYQALLNKLNNLEKLLKCPEKEEKKEKNERGTEEEIILEAERENNKYYSIITCGIYKKFLEEKENNNGWKDLFIPSKDTIMKTKEGWTCNENNKDNPMCLLYYNGAIEFKNWLQKKIEKNNVKLKINSKEEINLKNSEWKCSIPDNGSINKKNYIITQKNNTKIKIYYITQKLNNTKIASTKIKLVVIFERK